MREEMNFEKEKSKSESKRNKGSERYLEKG